MEHYKRIGNTVKIKVETLPSRENPGNTKERHCVSDPLRMTTGGHSSACAPLQHVNMLQLLWVDRFCGDALFLDVGYTWLQYKHVFLEQWLYGKMVICLSIAPDVHGHQQVVIRRWQAALWGTLQHLIRIYQNHYISMALFERGVYPQMPMVISG